MFLEKTYLPVINFIYDKTKWMNDKIRKAILTSCIVVEVLSTYIYQCDEFFGFIYYAMPNFLIGIVCFTGIILAGIDHKIERLELKKWLIYMLMICGAAVFTSGLHHYITYSYMMMGLFMCFVMPAFLIIWGNKEEKYDIFIIIAWVVVIFFIVFVIANAMLAPISNPTYSTWGERYFGMAADPNGLAKIAVTAYISAVYLIIVSKGAKKILFAPVVLVAIYYVMVSASRANFLGLILVSIISLVFLIKYYVMQSNHSLKLLKKIFVGFVVTCVLFIGGMIVSENCIGDSIIGDRLSQGVLEDGGIDLNTLSSGRMEIWQYCISEGSFIGHDISNGIGLGDVTITHDHVHNTSIELLHRSGILAGLSFFAIELYCIFWTLRKIFYRGNNTSIEIITVLLLIAFVIASVFDIVVLPFAKMTTFLFYMCLPVVFSKEENILDVTDDR